MYPNKLVDLTKVLRLPGDESLKLESINPLSVPDIEITEGFGPVSLKIIQKKIFILGLTTDVKIINLK